MTYGYESSLADSDNVQTLEDLSIGFIEVLSRLSRLSGRKPMFIVAHSLGGLIIKQVRTMNAWNPSLLTNVAQDFD